ncbi:MAG: tRNA (adenosine(37)-N6)-dimethylallyltransferase MiaA [Ignavibacteriaceae bacterium]|nr:tRNA (adenosine(37)-N6)-dimethylallyltransferase MiaA [Ignavibacteriaceae bacterium]
MGKLIVVIVGPTCSGKSNLSISIAKKLKSEIISADSRQVYKYIDIGTAKPSKFELKEIPHSFIDTLELDENFDVSSFEKQALVKIDNIIKNKVIPIVTGGSGLYVRALIDGIVDLESDDEIREELFSKKEKFGNDYLYHELEKVDSNAAKTMLPQNWKRVIRALEVFYLTGKSITDFHAKQNRQRTNYNFLQFGLNWKREILYKRIESRVDEMIKNGLVEEVKSILAKGYSETLNSLNSVGYKEIIAYLKNEVSLETAISLIKRNTRRYAKRQLTWFRKDERIHWFDFENELDLVKIKNEILNKIKDMS